MAPSITRCFALFLGPLLGLFFLASCETAGPSSGYGSLRDDHPSLLSRRARIAAEPSADYYIGRRFWIEGTRFWGFVRKPGQQWDQARLVVMNENVKKAPDRLPEQNPSGPSHGYDHNYEYKLKGRFSGEEIYDPNSNKILPEFMLTGYELISSKPGFLFHPNEVFAKNRIPKPPVYR
ncbi:MAG: hypothetical protein AAF191_11865 [Verrucomicrobiota bacterium]